MARIETWYNQDLKSPVKVHYLEGNVFSQDNSGNVVGVNVFDDGEEIELSGTVYANIVRSDGVTVTANGNKNNNKASIVLPAAAYSVPGVISIILKITSGNETTTLLAVVANVYQSSTDSAVDPGTIIPSIDALIAEIEAAVASIPQDYSTLNSTVGVGLATNAKNIVNNDLVFFRASGLQQNAVINDSTGEIGTGTGTGNNWVYADFIPVPKNETIYFQQHPDCTYNAFFYDENFAYLGKANPSTTYTNMFGITYKNADAAFVRFGCYKNGGYSASYDEYFCGFASKNDPYGVLVNGYVSAAGAITEGMTILHSANAITLSEPIEYCSSDSSLKLGAIIYDSSDNIIYRTGNTSGSKYISIPPNIKHRLLVRYSTYENMNVSTFPFDKLSIQKSGLGHFTFGTTPNYLTPNMNRFGTIDFQVADTDFIIHYPKFTGSTWNGRIMTFEFYDDTNTKITQGYYSIKYDILVPKGSHYRYSIGLVPTAETGLDVFNSVQRVPCRNDFFPQYLGINEQLGIIRSRLAALEGSSIPSYYQDHIESKADTIETLHSGLTSGDQFVFFTDYHANAYGNNTGHSMALIDYLLNNTHLFKVFNGGDILNTWRLRNDLDYGGMKNLVREMLGKQTPNAPCSYYWILGNHDTGMDFDGQGNECGPFITSQELYEISGQSLSHPYAVRDKWSYGWNYCFDDNTNKIRYLVMNGGLSSYGSNEGNRDTLRAVVNFLSSTPEGYTIVAFNHIILNNAGTALTSFITTMTAVFDSYNSKAVHTYDDLTFDFTGCLGGPVACVIGGHQHYDWDGTSTGGIPLIVTTTDNSGGSSDPSTRPSGTVNEQAFDVFTIDTTNKTIKATRIGSGSDRQWTYGT